MILGFVMILGFCVGSFCHVLTERLIQNKPLFHGRSCCNHCHTTLGFLDLIPLISYVGLKGRCKVCKSQIPFDLWLMELLMGLCWVFVFLTSHSFFECCINWTIVSILLMVAWIDAKTFLIRDRLILIIFCCGLILCYFQPPTLDRWIGATCISVPLLLTALLTNSIGVGDAKLMAVSGLILGWQANIMAFVIGVIFASIYAIFQILKHKKNRKDKIPLAPFLVLGILLSLFWFNPILEFYIHSISIVLI